MHFLLIMLPLAATAVYLPLAMLGLIGWRGETGARAALSAGAYLAAFLFIGQDFNRYWGLMYTPLLSLGLVWAPAALSDLGRAIRGAPARPA
jgi:hypothetical protein